MFRYAVAIRFMILLVGLGYFGYINDLLKESVSSINRIIIAAGFIYGIYSGILAGEAAIYRRYLKKK